MSHIRKEVDNNHKGTLAEALFERYSEVRSDNLPELHKFIHLYLKKNLSEPYEEAGLFYITVFTDKGESSDNFPVNPFLEYDFGFAPDLILTVSLRDEDTFESHGNAVFPVEIKTGSSSSLRDNQKIGLHEWTQNEKPGCGIQLQVYLNDLPEFFEYRISVIRNNEHKEPDWRDVIDSYSCSKTHAYEREEKQPLGYSDEEYGYPEGI